MKEGDTNSLRDDLKQTVSLLPELPGIYQYFNSEGKIIYVGKAKNLRKRVSSYFTKQHSDRKTAVLVNKIAEIKHIVLESEADALLLENNFIKKYQPRYNVLLKDDKSFPWICIKNERFPRVFYTRNVIRDGSAYFGPYTSVQMVRTILDVIRRLFPLRNCTLNLSRINIEKKKFKVCLEYFIGNCKGPCEGLQIEGDYNENIRQIKEILKGNLSSVMNHLKELMVKLSSEYKFEEAELVKSKLSILENYKSKSTVVSSSISNVDVFSFVEDESFAYINFLKVVDGAIVQAQTLEMKKRLEENPEDLLALGIVEIRQNLFSNSNEIIIPFPIEIEWKDIKLTVPRIGEKRKLLELSERNVKFYMLEKNKQRSLKNPETRTITILERIKSDLRLNDLPVHIECFDNSNIQGAFPVASCVVFRDTKPFKKDYRHFNIKTVEGPNDFASMEEIIYRRYRRMIDEGQDLPQLIVIDGGKGQLGSAVNSLERLNLSGKIPVIGIAKKLEEIFYPNDFVPLYLDKNSETLRVLQHLRNEAHRFGITFHRNKRSNEFLTSELESIPGVGEKTIVLLMKKFKTVKRLKTVSFEDLSDEIGKSKAGKVIDYFNSKVKIGDNKGLK
jgi:excinuclease ABC subunit C